MKMVLVCAVICLIYALTSNVQSKPLPRDLTKTQRYVLEKPHVLSRDLEDGSEKRSTESDSSEDSSEESDSSGIKDIDECATNNGNCEQLCSNTVGSYDCNCTTGYALNADGLSCDDVDECATNNGNCEQLCNNTVGSYDCNCMAGYVLNADGLSCDDVDECATNNGNCEQLCSNTVGSYDCNCTAGYALNADGLSCDDIDECATNNGNCEQLCSNTVGSYDCNCTAGYALNADGLSCDVTVPTCLPGWSKNGTSCYLFVQNQVTWEAARIACQEQSAYLTEVTTPAELTVLNYLIPQELSFWIGLQDKTTEGSFYWDYSGDNASFTSWGPDEPDDSKPVYDCVYMFPGDPARWFVIYCDESYTHRFICERQAECESKKCLSLII